MAPVKGRLDRPLIDVNIPSFNYCLHFEGKLNSETTSNTWFFFSQFSRIDIVAQEHLFQDVTQPGEGSTSTLLCDPDLMGTQ